jgi:hypothetical protein
MNKSEALAEAFTEYRSIRMPKGLNALTLDRVAVGHLNADAILAEYTARVRESIDRRNAALSKIGAFPASVNIRIVTPNGRTIDANGPRIVSAIVREDADIVKGQII